VAREHGTTRRCPTGKQRFADRVAALLALADSFRKAKGRRNEVRAYECGRCGGWHLTSKALYVRPELEPRQLGRERYQRPQLEREEPTGVRGGSRPSSSDRPRRGQRTRS
jgi:hypothetical protein